MQMSNKFLATAADAIATIDPAAAAAFRAKPFHRGLIAEAVVATLRKGSDPLDMASTIEFCTEFGMRVLREAAE